LKRKREISKFKSKSVKNPVVLIVLDGWGLAPMNPFNAITSARTPNFDRISKEFGSIEICASGQCVGLNDGQMGNSEVGHLTIGAGRVILQDLMRVSKELKSGNLERHKAIVSTFGRLARTNRQTLHFLGLVSDGGVHSHIDHLYGLLKIAKDYGVKRVGIHAILDGRDTPPKSGIGFVEALENRMKSLRIGRTFTVSGRYYAMDRDNRWERTKLAYDAIVHAAGRHFDESSHAINNSYDNGMTDEFVVPCVIGDYQGVNDFDVVFFFNFRPDRARQLTRALALNLEEFSSFDRGRIPKRLNVLTMTIYDSRLKNVKPILGRERVSNTLSNILEKNRIRQLRIAETEKYAHVTYFFNGLVEKPRRLEERILIPSAKEVGTYDKKPEMSAREITTKAISSIRSRNYGFILINFANADMVGHSGNMDATVRAVETVDQCIGEIYEAWRQMRGGDDREPNIIVTADHGNAEKKLDPETGQPHTAHTSNPVPLILVSDKWRLSMPSANYEPGLIDVAPSVLKILGLSIPKLMTGKPIATLR
jgi:2,3-bisphosphoglycerate-independent phosphoglycerate mutase